MKRVFRSKHWLVALCQANMEFDYGGVYGSRNANIFGCGLSNSKVTLSQNQNLQND